MAAAARRPRGERPSPRAIVNLPSGTMMFDLYRTQPNFLVKHDFVRQRSPRKRSPDAIVIGRQNQEASPEKGLFPGQTGEANRFQQKLPLGARKPRYTQAIGRKADANRRSPLRHNGLSARRIC